MERQQVIDALQRSSSRKGIRLSRLAKAMNASGRDRGKLKELLRTLEQEGRVYRDSQGRIFWARAVGMLPGIISVHPRQFAFVAPDEDDMEDIFIPPDDKGSAMHGDHVLVRSNGEEERPSGSVVRVLHRGMSKIVGTVRRQGRKGKPRLFPRDPRIEEEFLLEDGGAAVEDGSVVVAEILRYPGAGEPSVRITRHLGGEEEPGTGVAALMEQYDVQAEFPEAAWREADEALAVAERGQEEREDLQSLFTVTIDPEEAKDFDDALSIEPREGGGWRVWVHIADVSAYVREGSALDREARRRAFSLYLVDRVVPMLPPQLSSDRCSLRSGESRESLSVMVELDREGEVERYRITPALVEVDERLSYAEAQHILDRGAERAGGKQLLGTLRALSEVAALLERKRTKAGMLGFDMPEAEVRLDAAGTPLSVRVKERYWTYRIVEQYMVLANELVARFLEERKVPAVFRVHDTPSEEKLDRLRHLLEILGIWKGRIRPDHSAMRAITEKAKKTRRRRLIQTLLLRSLPRAQYKPAPSGHFGLALERYLHFTSPIRRYADLVVHRVVKALVVHGTPPARLMDRYAEFKAVAEHATAREETVDELERASKRMKILEYMATRTGEVFQGNISGVVSQGLFVELSNTAEGFLPVRFLEGDFYRYVEPQQAMIGSRSGKTYRLGDPIRTRVVRVQQQLGQMELEPA
ncbi:MAG: ribonuclease R [Synergistales bacterium]|nr:ribonuclease R [Synergistales bacterium]